jgi:hypothetical protein
MPVEVGQQYETTAVVTDRTGALTMPGQIHLNVTKPDTTVTNLDSSIVNDSLGTYHADYTMTMEGLHTFVWNTVGPTTYKTDVQNANVFRSIVGIDEARDFAGYEEGDRDDVFRMVLAAATEKVEDIVGSCVQRRYVNDRVPGNAAQVIRLPHAPLPSDQTVESIVSVYPQGPSWTDPTQFVVYPESATVELSGLVPFWRGPWKATYTAGRSVIPVKIQMAVKEIIYDLWSTQRPYGTSALEPGPEDTARFEQMLASYDIPPHAKSLLEGEERPGFD